MQEHFRDAGLPFKKWYTIAGHPTSHWEQVLPKLNTIVKPHKIDSILATLYDADETFSDDALPLSYASRLLGYPATQPRERAIRHPFDPHPFDAAFPQLPYTMVEKQEVKELYESGFRYSPADVPEVGNQY